MHHRAPLLSLAVLLALPACTPREAIDPDEDGTAGEGEGEGSSAAEGEGEGVVVAEGEGEGVVVAEGEGEGEGVVVAEGEGEGAPAPSSLYVDSGSIWTTGSRAVVVDEIASGGADAPPKPLRVFHPTTPGRYAVVVYQHGFLLSTAWTTTMLTQLSSHGFIVVAPQMYDAGGLPFGKPSVAEEAAAAASVHAWLRAHPTFAGAGVQAALDHVGVAGHSRGNKVLWTMLASSPSLANAVVALDPVDGTQSGGRICDASPDFSAPTAVVGTGLGPQSSGFLSQACAPDGDNHVQFAADAPAGSLHLLAPESGHLDLLDDDPCNEAPASLCSTITGACLVDDVDPHRFRGISAGVMTGFFRAHLQGDAGGEAAVLDVADAPGPLQVVP